MICDLAETYNILNYRKLPATLVASLVSGLRENSRCHMTLEKRTIKIDTLLLAAIVDRLSLIVWLKTKDAEKNRNRPKLILSDYFSETSVREHNIYKTGKDFEQERLELIYKKERE